MVAVGGTARGRQPPSCAEGTEQHTVAARRCWRGGFSTTAARVWFRWLVQDHIQDDDCDHRESAASTQLQRLHKVAARARNVCALPH